MRGRIVVGLVTVVVLGLLGAGGVYFYAEYRFHQIHREAVRGLVPVRSVHGDAPYNVLLVGDNCRYCLKKGEGTDYGSASSIAGGRSDVTMVLHVDPGKNRTSILSIPRDLWLPIPGSSKQIRVDAALNGGPGELVTTIEDDLDIPINHYIEFNFDTFKDVVNAIGGIDMDFPDRVYDSYSKLSAPAGCYHLNGAQALAVVRARHLYYDQAGGWQYDGLGDISRIGRDHEFIRVLGAAVRAQGLGDPSTDNTFVELAAKDLQIDNRFSLSSLLDLADAMSHVNLAKAPQTTLPVDEDNSPDGFVFDGDQYGDVVFPTWGRDERSIRTFLDAPLPGDTSAAATVRVRVVDAAGDPAAARSDATQLRDIGFPVTTAPSEPVASTPTETVVYYRAGHEADAQRVADYLDGAVALALDPAAAGPGVTLAVGSNLVVATRSAHTGAAHETHSPATIGGIVPAKPRYPGFDPRSCPAGATAPPLPTEPVPAAAVLPQT